MIADHIARIQAAEQRMKIEQFEIAEAERMLEAEARIPGGTVPPGLLESLLPEARSRVMPRLNLSGRFAYLGTT